VGATAETIWRVPAYLPYLQPPLTDDAIRSAEADIGYPLPAEFLDLLRRQNGGYIRYSLPENVHDSIAGIGPHFPSLTRFDWDESQAHVSYPLWGLVPFDGDGHWHLCLDYRQDPRAPAVALADIECDEESRVADSFAGYLGLLRVRVEDEFVLAAVSDIERVTADLSSALGARFDPPDTRARGYPVRFARLGRDRLQNPQCVWISPNTVPRGFVRDDDRRYSELKGLLPGVAERFPELPADSYLLCASDGVRARVLDACIRIGMSARPLQSYMAWDQATG
jgi:hypothetical protein